MGTRAFGPFSSHVERFNFPPEDPDSTAESNNGCPSVDQTGGLAIKNGGRNGIL